MNSKEWKVKWEVVVLLLAITVMFALCMHLS